MSKDKTCHLSSASLVFYIHSLVHERTAWPVLQDWAWSRKSRNQIPLPLTEQSERMRRIHPPWSLRDSVSHREKVKDVVISTHNFWPLVTLVEGLGIGAEALETVFSKVWGTFH